MPGSMIGMPLHPKRGANDWRLGLLVQPKYRADRDRLPPRAVIHDVLPQYPDMTDQQGILVLRVERQHIEGADPYYIIDGADNWVTA